MTSPVNNEQRIGALEDRIRDLERRLDEAAPRRVVPHYLRVSHTDNGAKSRGTTRTDPRTQS